MSEDYLDQIGFPAFEPEYAKEYILKTVPKEEINRAIDRDELFTDFCDSHFINCILSKEIVHKLRMRHLFSRQA